MADKRVPARDREIWHPKLSRENRKRAEKAFAYSTSPHQRIILNLALSTTDHLTAAERVNKLDCDISLSRREA